MADLIDRQAAIDVIKEELENGTFCDIPSKILCLPSAQPERLIEIVSDTYGVLFAKGGNGERIPIYVDIPESNYYGILKICSPELDGE